MNRIVANVAAIDYANAEIVISDRHCADDAIERLRERLSGDQRVRFATATDGCGWAEHYNLLLRQGSGTYFMWMPHDDEFPRGYVSGLVARLEAEPDVLMAYGWMDSADLEGRLISVGYRRPCEITRSWSQRSAVDFLRSWQWGVPFRGVFRGDAVVRSQLWLHSCRLADVCWLFGLTLLGALRFDPEVRCRKTLHSTSATASPPRIIGDMVDASRVMRSYVDDYVRDPATARRLRGVIHFWCANAIFLEASSRLSRRIGIPKGVRLRFRRFLQRPFRAV